MDNPKEYQDTFDDPYFSSQEFIEYCEAVNNMSEDIDEQLNNIDYEKNVSLIFGGGAKRMT